MNLTLSVYIWLSVSLLPPAALPQGHQLYLLGKKKSMGERMRINLALALAILMLVMMSSCLARKVIKVDVLKHDDTIVHGRQLLDEGDKVGAGYPESNVNNHHYIPRQDFNNYPVGPGDESG
ncbi:hypothetical protein QQP08_026589 [Theobroma cacao]|nr:hypothetical protein QQP08_026589 [Theobroma cacao]